MSRENVERFQRAVDAFNRRDVDASLEMLDPEAELHAVLEVMIGGE